MSRRRQHASAQTAAGIPDSAAGVLDSATHCRAQAPAHVKSSTIQVPADTTLQVMNTRPVWSATVKAGDPLYLQTVFPVQQKGHNVVPAGTYVAATLTAVLRPTAKQAQGMLEVRVDNLIFADGYTVPISASSAPTLAVLTLAVTDQNDLLLDNGTQFSLATTAPLTLDKARVHAAVPLSHPPRPGSFTSATLCRFQPGTPPTPGSMGTPDTVIPGTPDTVIAGIDGAPDTVIPGTPGTTIPGQPATPADPGTPDIPCPAPPEVTASTPETIPQPLALASAASPSTAKHKR
jgi:hypothetical protein